MLDSADSPLPTERTAVPAAERQSEGNASAGDNEASVSASMPKGDAVAAARTKMLVSILTKHTGIPLNS